MRKHAWAILAILTLAPCVRAEEESLSGDRALAGLGTFGLLTAISTPEDAARIGLTEEKLETQAYLVLNRNQLVYIRADKLRKVPQLRVTVRVSALTFHCSVELLDTVAPNYDPDVRVRGLVWRTGAAGAHGLDGALVLRHVASSVEKFALAYLKYNPDASPYARAAEAVRDIRRGDFRAEGIFLPYLVAYFESVRSTTRPTHEIPDLGYARSQVLKALVTIDPGDFELHSKLAVFLRGRALACIKTAGSCAWLGREGLSSSERKRLQATWREALQELAQVMRERRAFDNVLLFSVRDLGSLYYLEHYEQMSEAFNRPPVEAVDHESIDRRISRASSAVPPLSPGDIAWAASELAAVKRGIRPGSLTTLKALRHEDFAPLIRYHVLNLDAILAAAGKKKPSVNLPPDAATVWSELVEQRAILMLGTALDWGNAPALSD